MVAANLRRLMARHGMTVQALAEAAGIDVRTVKSMLNERRQPHAHTLHKLASGLDVSADEFFQPLASSADSKFAGSPSFDRATNPTVAKLLSAMPERFIGWTGDEIDELFSRVGTGGELNDSGVDHAIHLIESRREILEKAAVILETDEGELLRGIVEMLFARLSNVD